jgi:hypothetical protein
MHVQDRAVDPNAREHRHGTSDKRAPVKHHRQQTAALYNTRARTALMLLQAQYNTHADIPSARYSTSVPV